MQLKIKQIKPGQRVRDDYGDISQADTMIRKEGAATKKDNSTAIFENNRISEYAELITKEQLSLKDAMLVQEVLKRSSEKNNISRVLQNFYKSKDRGLLQQVYLNFAGAVAVCIQKGLLNDSA